MLLVIGVAPPLFGVQFTCVGIMMREVSSGDTSRVMGGVYFQSPSHMPWHDEAGLRKR